MACERRRSGAAANEASTSRDGVAGPSGAAEEEMDTGSDSEGSSSHHVSETSSSSCSSGVPRSGSGERASHASTAENPIGSPVMFDDTIAANAVQRPVVDANPAESSDEDMDEMNTVDESAEDEPPVNEVVTDDENLSAYVPGSSTVSPEIGSFRPRPRPIASDETE